MTAHWIYDNRNLWNLVIAVVEIEGDHSGQDLEHHLFKVLEDFDIVSEVFVSQAILPRKRHNCNVLGATVYHYRIQGEGQHA